MSDETSRGRATKDAFSKALTKRLQAGEDFADISIRTLAEDCNVDRQTFYYHFRNMQALAVYTYEREIDQLLNTDEIKASEGADWKTRARIVLGTIGQTSDFKECIEPLIDMGVLWTSIAQRVEIGLHRDFDEVFSSYDMDDEERDAELKNLSFAITAIYIAWTRRDIGGTLEDAINSVERIRNDFLVGAAARHSSN